MLWGWPIVSDRCEFFVYFENEVGLSNKSVLHHRRWKLIGRIVAQVMEVLCLYMIVLLCVSLRVHHCRDRYLYMERLREVGKRMPDPVAWSTTLEGLRADNITVAA